jgi:hypothetical protein
MLRQDNARFTFGAGPDRIDNHAPPVEAPSVRIGRNRADHWWRHSQKDFGSLDDYQEVSRQEAFGARG